MKALAAVGCVLVLAATGCGRSSSYTLMQMNLCLSGIAGCYSRTAYPAVLDEAAARIRGSHPDAVTLNEACGNDVAQIARQTGYRLRFAREIYFGKPLPCVRPGGRGLFGEAVLVRAPITATHQQEFKGQEGAERRLWLCVDTRRDVEVCTAHLNTRLPLEVEGNDAQCTELKAVLARRAAGHAVIFGGDVNRLPSCAPNGFWTRTDRAARQKPGAQQVYVSAAFRSPSSEVLPATHTDHDFLLVRAELERSR